MKNKKKLLAIPAAVVIIALVCIAYLSDFYEAHRAAPAFMPGNYSENSPAPKHSEGYISIGPDEATTGFVFYPGGKVEADAYIPLMYACAEYNIKCVIAEMPFNLAVFDTDAAKKIISEFSQIDSWYIGGHSLGGSMAASFAAENKDTFEGLVLLGAYSTADLSKADTAVLSIYGSEDKIMNREKYAECAGNLPQQFSEFVIEGGNHAFFGVYGVQDGDGTAAITNEEQIKITAEKIAEFIFG